MMSPGLLTENRISFLSVGLSRFFPTENRLFEVGFSVAQKKRNRKSDSVFFGRFVFPLSPTPIIMPKYLY